MLDLAGILALLDDPDVTEVVIASSQPVTIRKQGGYKAADPAALSVDDILELATGTALARLLERPDGDSATIGLLGRAVRVEVNRFGERVMIRLLRGPRASTAIPVTVRARSPVVESVRDDRRHELRRDDRTSKGGSKDEPAKFDVSKIAPPRFDPPKGDPLPRADAPAKPKPLELDIDPDTGPPGIDLGLDLSQPPPEPPPPKPPDDKPPIVRFLRAKTEPGMNQGQTGPQSGRPDAQSTALRESQPIPRADSQPLPRVDPQVVASDSQPSARDAQPIPRLDVRPDSQPSRADARPSRITLPPAPPRRTTISLPIRTTPLPPLAPPAEAPVFPEFVALVEQARQRKATDLHVVVGQPAMLRVAQGLVASGEPLSADDVDALLSPLLSTAQHAQLDQRGYVDAAVDLGPTARLRMNLSRTRSGLKGSFRMVMTSPPTLEQLGLPVELARVTTYHQGLVLIAGPNGHGKTTTLGALVDLINRSKAHHILTVEDPVEILHPRKKAVISQREVGTHTKSFATALKASLREDPDVIVIGELRDRESVEIALTAAETGHLVIATTSTPSAAKSIDRLIDNFPPAEQSQVRASLAAALRFVVAQRLLPGVDGSLVAAVELVTGVLPLAAMIRDDKLFQLGSLLQRGRAFGMIRLDDSLAELVRAGKITEQVALQFADNKRELEQKLPKKGRP